VIEETEKLLIDAILAFENKACELIELLANQFDLNLNDRHPFDKIKSRQTELWKGILKEKWNYQFHGDACKFENIENGQLLDVKINRRGNYGTISNYYLLKFIETTNELEYVYDKINNSESIYNTIAKLEEKELIINIGESPLNTRILNKEKVNALQQGL